MNLKTAKTLGITIPQSILLQAERVIEWRGLHGPGGVAERTAGVLPHRRR